MKPKLLNLKDQVNKAKLLNLKDQVNKAKLLIIVGPTGTGKTDLGIRLAKQLNGEIVGCDSRQVYKDLDIGTGKLPGGVVPYVKEKKYWVVDGVKIRLYDVVSFNQRYTANDYIQEAVPTIKQISQRGVLPIIVGGTGLYLKALLHGFSIPDIAINLELRHSLEKMEVEELRKKLMVLSPAEFNKMNNSDQHNKRRLVRKIEILSYSPIDTRPDKFLGISSDFDLLKIGLSAPREILNDRIDKRLDSHLEQGLVEEAKLLYQKGLDYQRMRELGLEYSCLADLLENKIDYQDFVQKLKTKIHQYAKRQMTWFKSDAEIRWFDISQQNVSEKVVNLCVDWYN